MPFWLVILINMALRFGVPWLLKRFPFLPPNIREIIEKLIGDLDVKKAEKRDLVAKAKADIKACVGPNCPVE